MRFLSNETALDLKGSHLFVGECDAPVGVVGQQRRRELVEKKAEILSILTAETTAIAEHPEDIDPNDERTDALVLSERNQRAQLAKRLMEAIRHAPDVIS